MSLGPAVLGPLGRTARGGRNWEGFGADPYFSGILGAHAVKATQERGLMACSKVSIHSNINLWMHELMPPPQHFVGNEQETQRFPNYDPENNRTVESSSSNIDDKTMHEMYLWPFADAVHAGSASISKSYHLL